MLVPQSGRRVCLGWVERVWHLPVVLGLPFLWHTLLFFCVFFVVVVVVVAVWTVDVSPTHACSPE